jgi:protein-disulfide isomerase
MMKTMWGIRARVSMAAVLVAALVWGAIMTASALRAAAGDAPITPGDRAKIEKFLAHIVESGGGGRLVVEEWKASPIPGVQEVHYFIDAAGKRKPGLIYVAGDKLILGQIIDTSTEKNLTVNAISRPTKLVYQLEDFDLKGRVPRGDPSARLTLIEFSDFQCPYCRQLYHTLDTLMTKYPGQVRIYYKHLPLVNIHPLAYTMALAAECAREQKADAFWALHDDFFTDQMTGGDVTALMVRLKIWAAKNGLNGDALDSCVTQRKPANRIEADLHDAKTLGITSTPVVIANGEFIGGAQPVEVFERFLKPSPSHPSASSPPAQPSH